MLLFERHQLAEAIVHLTDATRIAPRSATAHAALGGALAQAGLNEAVMHLEQALTLDPSNTAACENLSRISRK